MTRRFGSFLTTFRARTHSSLVTLAVGLTVTGCSEESAFTSNPDKNLEQKKTQASAEPGDAPSETELAGQRIEPQATLSSDATAAPVQVEPALSGMLESIEKQSELAVLGELNATLEEVRASCAAGALMTEHRVQVEFPATDQGCKWFPSEHEDKDWVQGLAVQESKIPLPANKVICQTSIMRAPAVEGAADGKSTAWRFDDEVFLTIGPEVLLASSDTAHVKRLPVQEGLTLFDYAKLHDFKYDRSSKGDSEWCLGTQRGPLCDLPASEKSGPVNLQIAVTGAETLSRLLFNQNETALKLYVTGDNNPNVDCRHSGIVFEVAFMTADLKR